MARVSDPSLPYFPLNCVLDDKFSLIEAEFGLTGFAIVIKLYQRIYGGEGYFCEWNEDICMLFSRQVGEDKELIASVVEKAVERGIFSNSRLRNYQILTSRGIQRQYLSATARRKNVPLIEEYILLNFSELPSNVDIESLNVDSEALNVDRNTQSKVKESRVKETKSKVKERRAKERECEGEDENTSQKTTYQHGYQQSYSQSESECDSELEPEWVQDLRKE